MRLFDRLFNRPSQEPSPSAPDIIRGTSKIPEGDPLTHARQRFNALYRLEQDPNDRGVRVRFLKNRDVSNSESFLKMLKRDRKEHLRRAQELERQDPSGAEIEREAAQLTEQFITIAEERIVELQKVQPLKRPDLPEEERKAA